MSLDKKIEALEREVEELKNEIRERYAFNWTKEQERALDCSNEYKAHELKDKIDSIISKFDKK